MSWDPKTLGISIRHTRETLGLTLMDVGSLMIAKYPPKKFNTWESVEYWATWAQRMEGDGLVLLRPTRRDLDLMASVLLDQNTSLMRKHWGQLAGYEEK